VCAALKKAVQTMERAGLNEKTSIWVQMFADSQFRMSQMLELDGYQPSSKPVRCVVTPLPQRSSRPVDDGPASVRHLRSVASR
jgi:hypothetical protein